MKRPSRACHATIAKVTPIFEDHRHYTRILELPIQSRLSLIDVHVYLDPLLFTLQLSSE